MLTVPSPRPLINAGFRLNPDPKFNLKWSEFETISQSQEGEEKEEFGWKKHELQIEIYVSSVSNELFP